MLTTRMLVLAWIAIGVGVVTGRAEAAGCQDLVGLKMEHATVKSAEVVDKGVLQPEGSKRSYDGLPSFCRVRGVSTPVAGSEIGFEVWLPKPQAWTKRLHMVGNGAYSSNIYYAQMAARIRAGDVAVGTDTGHQGGELTFAIGHPERIVDFAHRAVHESVAAAKVLTEDYYGNAPAYSYFSGCSTGGYQALMAAQRHPQDFDGIIAGDPGNNRTNLNLAFLWQFLKNHPPGDNQHQIIPNEKLLMVNRAIVGKCDRMDAVEDGVINDPRSCHFDLRSMRCKAGDAPDCLTDPQIRAMEQMYAGPKDSRTGKALYPGYTFGSEGVVAGEGAALPGWSAYWSNPQQPDEPQRADFYRYWVFNDPHWDWWKFNWGSDIDTVDHTVGQVFNATNTDLHEFAAHQGKLIMFMGWQDPVGAAAEAINYYDGVQPKGDFVRLYMVPGMAHCAGGPGATHFSTATRDSEPPVSDAQHDMAIALQDWVERGVAPGTLIASHFEKAQVAFQRPLCVYPRVARYKGGPTDAASSFACVAKH